MTDAALTVLARHLPIEQVEQAEAMLLAAEAAGHGVELVSEHHFADGLVARTIRIPAGTALTGAPHKAPHLCVVCGDIEVTTDAGVERITGFRVLEAGAGIKRVGLAHADTWWTSIHLNPDNGRDVTAIEDRLVEQAERLQRRRLLLGSAAALQIAGIDPSLEIDA